MINIGTASRNNVSPITWRSLNDRHYVILSNDFQFRMSLQTMLLMFSVYERPASEIEKHLRDRFRNTLGPVVNNFHGWFKDKLFLRKVGADPLLFFPADTAPSGPQLFRILYTRSPDAMRAALQTQWSLSGGTEEQEDNPGTVLLEQLKQRRWTPEDEANFETLGMLPPSP